MFHGDSVSLEEEAFRRCVMDNGHELKTTEQYSAKMVASVLCIFDHDYR